MELHNGQVPGDTVWAVKVTAHGTYDEHRYVDWYLTAEASSEDYRAAVAHQRSHSGGTVERWKIALPRRRMDREDVALWVEEKLNLQDPDGTAQLLDVAASQVEPRRGGGK